jgi:undecaprenyl-diphosphatase
MHDPISYFEALILGIIQGLTEFLPISSSAHILIVSTLAGWGDPGAAFTAVTQLGTETAVLVYFRKDIWRIITTWTRSLYTPELRSSIDARMGWYVIVGTIPIGFFGYTFSDQIETAARNLYLVATVLIVFGLVLGAADRWGKQDKTLDDLTIKTGLIYGFGQALALIPGVSRSGATISTGRVLGFDRPSATRYAFLLAIPAVVVSGLYEALKIGDDKNVSWGPTILATVVAFFVGYAVISWLIRYVSHGSFLPFVIYRVALGTLVLVLLGTGVITA